jgi:hypothetical protein
MDELREYAASCEGKSDDKCLRKTVVGCRKVRKVETLLTLWQLLLRVLESKQRYLGRCKATTWATRRQTHLATESNGNGGRVLFRNMDGVLR